MSKKISSILLVDDDTVIDYLHKKLLLKAGIVAPITTLYNGRKAIEELTTLNNQLSSDDCLTILLDLNMPILDGWGFLEELDLIFTTLKFKIELLFEFDIKLSSLKKFIVPVDETIEPTGKPKTESPIVEFILKSVTYELMSTTSLGDISIMSRVPFALDSFCTENLIPIICSTPIEDAIPTFKLVIAFSSSTPPAKAQSILDLSLIHI